MLHQLVGGDIRWDRIGIAQYRDPMAIIEMSSNADFKKNEQHKDAGMDFTIVLASFPAHGEPVPPQRSGAGNDCRLLLQVVSDETAPDIADEIKSTRIGRFWIEGRL